MNADKTGAGEDAWPPSDRGFSDDQRSQMTAASVDAEAALADEQDRVDQMTPDPGG